MADDRAARTTDLVERDLRSVWHPFTQHAGWPADEPLVIDRADGPYLYDTDGNRYLDGVASLWVTTHGHHEPAIDQAIRDQLDRLDHATFLGLTHEPGIRLAEDLLAIAPAGLTRVFYAGDGSSAVEAAIKMTYQAASQRGEYRPYFVHVAEGYHGDTLGAVSVGGIELFHRTYRPIVLDTKMISSPGVRAPGQDPGARAAEVLAELRELMAEAGTTVCSIVIEPMVQGAGGMLTHHADFVRGVREVCDQYGVAMVADEVATGLGATGRWWAVDHAGVSPDLLVCGKRVTGGYLPLSAVLATERTYDAFLGKGRTFYHGHTYTANPLCAAAGIANLRLMRERSTVERAAKLGERMGDLLAPLASYDGVAEIRRVGTMTGVEVRSVGDRTGFRVCQAARRRGVIVRPLDDVVVLMPPLGLGDNELDELCGAVDEAVREVVR